MHWNLNVDIGCVRSIVGFCQEDIGDLVAKKGKGHETKK